MERHFNVVSDRRGNAISGATVTIKTEAGATATIYSDDGVTTTPNPLTTNADGEYTFFAANGKYTVQVVADGYGGETISDVVLYDPADVAMSINEITTAAYTLSDDDIGQWLDFNTSATAVATMTTASGYASGDSTIFRQKGAGTVKLAAGSGVTINNNSSLLSRAQYAVIALTTVTANVHTVYGDTA